jgi:hypothetical protein
MNLTSDIPPVVFDKLPVVPLVGSVPLPGPAHQVDLSPEVLPTSVRDEMTFVLVEVVDVLTSSLVADSTQRQAA